MSVERLQRKAAELILEDEAWRDGLEDASAGVLLDWVLARVDRAIAEAPADVDDAAREDLVYIVAGQARAVLSAVGQVWQGVSQEEARANLEPGLQPPLFAGADEFWEEVRGVLTAAGAPGTEAAATAPDSNDPDGTSPAAPFVDALKSGENPSDRNPPEGDVT